jgi:outer membrane protein OmpA-like peptidoglycan-associated protein
MMTERAIKRMTTMAIGAAALLAVLPVNAADPGVPYLWHISVMGGGIDYEGDEPLDDALLGALGIGYNLSSSWTLEGVVEYCPDLDGSIRRDWATGERVSRLGEGADRDLSETSAIRLAVDGLLHLAPESRFDPYLAAGLGLVAYEHDFDQQYEPVMRAGAGLFANITDRVALRLDGRVLLSGADTEFNFVTTAGVVFRFGAGPGAGTAAGTAAEAGAGDEAGAGAESGVVIAPAAAVVHVEPTPPPLTVKTFILQLNFEPGKSEIKSEYRSELDVIGRLLDRQSASTARIEGHEKPGTASDEQALQKLSEERAQAVRDYLKDNWKIRVSRMQTAGLGTARPAGDPDQSGQRIEVYVTLP